MILKIIVNNMQIGDAAPRDESSHILRDEFCKVGDTISFDPSVTTTFDSLKKSKEREKSVTLLNDSEYNVKGEILAGIMLGGVYLIIDCGVLLRVATEDPREYEGKKSIFGWTTYNVVKKDVMKKFVFRKHDFISFNGKIQGMWLDQWTGIVCTNLTGKVIDRVDNDKEGLLLTIECSYPEKPLIEVDEFYVKRSNVKIWDESTSFTIEY